MMKNSLVSTTAAILAACVLPALGGWAESFTGKVTEVVKGDVMVLMHGDKPETVRLAGVDSPELAQKFGPEAKKFTTDLALNQEITVVLLGKDGRGRTVGEVSLPDGRDLNREILSAGMGWYYDKHPIEGGALRSAGAKAITAKKGLWADAAPLAPWDFRGDARKNLDLIVTPAPAEPKKEEVKTVSAKGNLEGVQREVFAPPKSRKAELAKYLDNPIAKQYGVGLHKDANGNVDGIQASNLGAFPAAALFGFQDGDILSSVNGDRINSEDQIMNLFDKYKDARTFNVGIIRNGQPQNLSVDISKFVK